MIDDVFSCTDYVTVVRERCVVPAERGSWQPLCCGFVSLYLSLAVSALMLELGIESSSLSPWLPEM
jgi:hypothetical protein